MEEIVYTQYIEFLRFQTSWHVECDLSVRDALEMEIII